MWPVTIGRRPGAGAQPLGGGVAGLARGGLDVAGRQLGPLDVEVDPQLGAELAAGALVGGRRLGRSP